MLELSLWIPPLCHAVVMMMISGWTIAQILIVVELEGLGDLGRNLGNGVRRGLGVVFMNDKKNSLLCECMPQGSKSSSLEVSSTSTTHFFWELSSKLKEAIGGPRLISMLPPIYNGYWWIIPLFSI